MRASLLKCAVGLLTADNVVVDTSGFTKILGPFDDDLQKALATLDVLPEYAQEAGFPRGIEDRDDSELLWDDATLTLTQAIKAPATGFSIIEAASGTAVRHTFVADQTATIEIPAAGGWWFYYDGGVLQSAQTLPYGFRTTICAYVFLNASNSAIAVLDERHTVFMPWKTHQYLHMTLSTRYQSGLAIGRIASGSGNMNGDAEIYLTGGQIWDEDIAVDISRSAAPIQMFAQELGEVGVPGQIPIYYRGGVGSSNWEKLAASSVPLYQILAAQRPTFNTEVGGSWTRTEISNNGRHCIMWICATSNIGNADKLGFMVEPVFAIMGQGDYTIGQAQETTFSQLNLGDLFTNEMKPLYKLIYRCSTGYSNDYHAYIHQISDLRVVSPAPSGSVVVTDHQSLGGRTVDNSHPALAISVDELTLTKMLSSLPEDSDVQDALEVIDNFAEPVKVFLTSGENNTNSTSYTRLGCCILDVADYNPTLVTTTYNVVVAAQSDNSNEYSIRLYDVTAGAYVGGTITASNNSLSVVEIAAVPLGANERIYELHGKLNAGGGGADYLRVCSAYLEVSR